jgi:hypothetical protein
LLTNIGLANKYKGFAQKEKFNRKVKRLCWKVLSRVKSLVKKI